MLSGKTLVNCRLMIKKTKTKIVYLKSDLQ